jgi:hypothetical protein
VKEIPLTGRKGLGKFIVVDDEDYDMLSKYSWNMGSSRYASTNVLLENGKRTCRTLHSFIFNPGEGKVTDHINLDRLDNRKSNLRSATPSQNNANCKIRSHNTAGYKGVSRDYHRYVAAITNKGKRITIGRYDSAKEAAIAYNVEAIKLFGEFANLNIVD